MSASLLTGVLRFCPKFNPSKLLPVQIPLYECVRGHRVKTSGVTKNRKGRSPGKRWGVKCQDGSFVHEGEILVTQPGLRYYPGENVSVGRRYALVAARSGRVCVTSESLQPYPDSPIYDLIYKRGQVIKKKFFHVYPIALHGKFRLVSEV